MTTTTPPSTPSNGRGLLTVVLLLLLLGVSLHYINIDPSTWTWAKDWEAEKLPDFELTTVAWVIGGAVVVFIAFRLVRRAFRSSTTSSSSSVAKSRGSAPVRSGWTLLEKATLVATVLVASALVFTWIQTGELPTLGAFSKWTASFAEELAKVIGTNERGKQVAEWSLWALLAFLVIRFLSFAKESWVLLLFAVGILAGLWLLFTLFVTGVIPEFLFKTDGSGGFLPCTVHITYCTPN
jgi:hypothetical protein